MIETKWDSVLLVCKDCRKRSKGPRDLKSKAVVSALKHAAKETRPRPRIVSVSCLGICPSGALAVARVGGGAATQVACIATLDQVAGASQALLDASA